MKVTLLAVRELGGEVLSLLRRVQLRPVLGELVATMLCRPHLSLAIDRDADIPQSVIDGLGKLGVLGMTAPVAQGGRGFSQMGYCKILEVIGDWPGSKFEVPYAVADKPGLEVVRIIESTKGDDETWWIYIRRMS